MNEEQQWDMTRELLRLRELSANQAAALKWAKEEIAKRDQLIQDFRNLGTVYRYPNEWSCAKEGGLPTIDDYDQLDLSTFDVP